MTTENLVDEYMRRLADLGAAQDSIGRFYVALHDERLREIEEWLAEAGDGMELHQPVLSLYNRWKDEMGPEAWGKMWAHNEDLGDADRNWLVSEAMDTEVSASR